MIEILRLGGYVVDCAADGGGALVAALLNPPSLVLLDWELPGLPRGADLIRKLRKDHGAELPVVVISAEHSNRNPALSAGASDFISKPFEISELLDTVDYFSYACRYGTRA